MAWVKLDDRFDEHPKVARLSDSAFALFVSGLAYCNRNLTDGFIPRAVGLGQLRYCDGNTQPYLVELEKVGLWEAVDGGWQVHDFLDFQPSKEQVVAEREAARERKQKSRAKSQRDTTVTAGDVTGGVTTPPDPVPVPDKPSSSNGLREFNAKRALDEATREAKTSGTVRNPEALATWKAKQTVFRQESQRLWNHRNCETCKGKGFTEDYAPGAGQVRLPCKEATHGR